MPFLPGAQCFLPDFRGRNGGAWLAWLAWHLRPGEGTGIPQWGWVDVLPEAQLRAETWSTGLVKVLGYGCTTFHLPPSTDADPPPLALAFDVLLPCKPCSQWFQSPSPVRPSTAWQSGSEEGFVGFHTFDRCSRRRPEDWMQDPVPFPRCWPLACSLLPCCPPHTHEISTTSPKTAAADQ